MNPLTRADLENLKPGQLLFHRTRQGSDHLPVRCRVNGKLRTWKRDPERFELPVKHGLRNCFYITPTNLAEWSAEEN